MSPTPYLSPGPQPRPCVSCTAGLSTGQPLGQRSLDGARGRAGLSRSPLSLLLGQGGSCRARNSLSQGWLTGLPVSWGPQLSCPSLLLEWQALRKGPSARPFSQSLPAPLLPSRVPESQALGAPLRILLVSLWDSLLGSPRGALEFHGGWGTGGESWGLQAPGRLE